MSILNARGAGRLARTTPETAVNVRFKRHRIKREALFLHGAHQVDATARTVVLIAGDDVSRTGLETKAAVNAGQDFFFFYLEGPSK